MLKKWMYCIAFMGVLLSQVAQAPEETKPLYGISLYGDPLKYPQDFKNFEYVNEKAPKGGILNFGVLGTFDSFNPFVVKGQPAAGITYLYPSLLFVTLTAPSQDEPSSVYCYAAESMEIAPDRAWIGFTMREGISFHDGSSLTVDDVIYSFNTLKDKGQPFYKAYYEDVVKVEKVDARRLKFILRPNASKEVIQIIGQFPIISKAFYTKHGFEKADLTPPLGNGPYKISQFKPGSLVAYERVKEWWGEKLPINVGRYNFDSITYKYYRDETVMFESFKRGDYDFRIETSSKRWAEGYNIPAIQEGKIIRKEVTSKNPEPMQALAFNLRRSLFQDVRVRQALGYFLDFEWLNENIFHSAYARLQSYFQGSDLASSGAPSQSELEVLKAYQGKLPENIFTTAYVPPKTDGSGNIRQNLNHAKKLLEQAGWAVKDGVLTHRESGQPFEFEILLAIPDMERVIQGFVKNLKRLGISAKIRIVDTAQYMRRVDTFDYDMIFAVYLQSISPGNEQREFWSSSRATIQGSKNYIGIKDPTIDEVIEKLISATTREQLITYCRVLDRLLLWGYYVIPAWYRGKNPIAYWKKLKHPKIIPPYGIDIYAWWSADAEKAN
jgi:microcin C transport system substrate-binding protein